MPAAERKKTSLLLSSPNEITLPPMRPLRQAMGVLLEHLMPAIRAECSMPFSTFSTAAHTVDPYMYRYLHTHTHMCH